MPNFKEQYDFKGGEILLFDKPLEWTSFDVVNKVRFILCRKLGIKKLKVGHAGTLDPLATGLVVLCTGKSTKRIEEFQNGEKEYIAELKIGATTPSFDLETEEDSSANYDHVNRELAEKVLQSFVGSTQQTPPIFSAVKINGKRAFNYARKGEDVEIKPRTIFIREIELINFAPPHMTIRVVCGKGTYIRALARDVGEKLNCGAYLTKLKRTRVGDFHLKDAFDVNYFLEHVPIEPLKIEPKS